MTRFLASAAVAACLALPISAQGIDDMTDAEREAFRAEVRAYLLDNPEVLMEAIAVLEERQAEQQAAGDASLVAANADALFADGHSWVGGNPDGDLTMVEFMDYRCGYCRRAAPDVAELVESDGDIRLVVKEFPILGEQSVLASRFAIATKRIAGDAAYKDVHDALITMRSDVTEAALRNLAQSLDLDDGAILAEMDAPEVTEVIRENHALAERMQISGTPTFVVGDEMLRGYLPLDGMRERVAAARGEG